MTGLLTGRSVLITGGNSGIGKGAARAVVAEGGRVAIVGRDEAKLAAAATEIGTKDRVLPIAADVSRLNEIERMVDGLCEGFGQIDGLFANAGYGRFGSARDDGGLSGGSMERPALERLLAE